MLWAWALGAAGGSRGAGGALVVLAAVWSALAQGAVGLVACPPPCGGATRLQDAAQFLSFVLGAWVASATARSFGEGAGRISPWPTVFALALIAGSFVLQGTAFLAAR
jgi:hypothetical protein